MMRVPSVAFLILGATVAFAYLFGTFPAEADEREEYVTTAQIISSVTEDLAAFPGKEATVMNAELPAGWVGSRHYHTGDVFVYVLEGSFVVDVEDQGRLTFGPGEVYHEAVDKTMVARNPSTTEATKLILFQVGNKGEPLMIKVDD